MLFSSVTFLFYFLPIVFLVYFAVPFRFKNGVLLVFSLLFYFFGEPIYVGLLLFSSLSDYLHALYIEKNKGGKIEKVADASSNSVRENKPSVRAKVALISSITVNLALLGFFKYADFFIVNINGLFGTQIPLLNLSLPIGISFFTFQTMSYTIDVYRGEVKAERNLATFAAYVSLFPQLVAGPIVRYRDVSAELHQRSHSWENAAVGTRRFVIGLSKKILLANSLGELCRAFRGTDDPSVLFYWIYAVAFMLQIYFDFSGYSDMAIGLGRIFGFRFPENFNYPYTAKSITEFWRRWHMTLSGWFRDYVYIPLGGNRVSLLKWVRNILLVWMLTGFWHGAEWNFVLWGLFFGVLLLLEKKVWGKALGKAPAVLQTGYTLFLVLISFVIFNASGMQGVAADLKGLFGFADLPLWSSDALYQLRNYGGILLLSILGAVPLWKKLAVKTSEKYRGIFAAAEPVVLVLLLLVCSAYLIDGSFNPFLYFRF